MSPDDPSSVTALTSKGQIIISSRIRSKLAFRRGQRFVEHVEDGKVILEPLETPLELKGALREMAEGKATEELIREVKGGWK